MKGIQRVEFKSWLKLFSIHFSSITLIKHESVFSHFQPSIIQSICYHCSIICAMYRQKYYPAGAVEYTDFSSAEGQAPPTNECPANDTKQSDGVVPVMPELWGIRSTSSLPSLPGPLWPGVVAPDKSPIYGLNRTKPWFLEFTGVFWHLNCVFMLNWIVSNRTILTFTVNLCWTELPEIKLFCH